MVEEIKKMYHENNVSMPELLHSLIVDEGYKISDEEIQELLEWSGDDECVTVEYDHQLGRWVVTQSTWRDELLSCKHVNQSNKT